MASSHQTEVAAVELIKTIINQYNDSVASQESIKGLYRGASDSLYLIGRTATFSPRQNESKIVTIPPVFIPHMHLRKEYGIPIIEQNHDVKLKDKLNYHQLSMISANHADITEYYHSTLNVKKPLKIAEIHKVITETILNMRAHNYIRNLKKLLVLMTYMMLIDEKGKDKSKDYLSLLENERSILELELRGKSDMHLFNKYVARIKNILTGNTLPVHADDDLRSAIQNRYPILYCAVVDPENKNILHLDAVKIMFTPHEHVENLKERVEKMQLQVKVHGYDAPLLENIAEHASEEELLLLNAANIDELDKLTKDKPHLFASTECAKAKIQNCLASHFQGQENSHLAMAALLMKNIPVEVLSDITKTLEHQFNLGLYEIVQYKDKLNKEYLKNAVQVISQDYFTKLNDLAYLKSLLTLRLNSELKDSSHHLFDYSHEAEKLHALISPNAEAYQQRSDFLLEYISRLQHLYAVFKKDVTTDPENVNKHIEFIKNKYAEAVKEYKKLQPLDHRIIHSELYKATAQPSLIIMFFGQRNSARDEQLHHFSTSKKNPK